MQQHLSSELLKSMVQVYVAVQMALHVRRPAAGMIRPGEQGNQYTAVRYGAKLVEHG